MAITKVKGSVDGSVLDNIEALLSASQSGQYTTLGYHTAGDGGGGEFYWDSSQDKANHNGGTIIDPDITFPSDWTNQTQVTAWFTATGVTTGCWVRVYSGSINVRWFGAVGDVVTDDYLIIVNALSTLKSNGGGTLVLPYTGNGYKVSQLVEIDFGNVVLDIRDNITLTTTTASGLFKIYGTAVAYIDNVTIYGNGVTIDGNGSNIAGYSYSSADEHDTLLVDYVNNFRCFDLHVTNGLINCLRTRFCSRPLINGCVFSESVHDNGCSINRDLPTYLESDINTYSQAIVSDSWAHNCQDFGFTAYDASMVSFTDLKVNNCGTNDPSLTGGGFSYELEPASGKDYRGNFSNCRTYNCIGNGFHITASGVSIDSECVARGTTYTPTDTANLYGNGLAIYNAQNVHVSGEYSGNSKRGVNWIANVSNGLVTGVIKDTVTKNNGTASGHSGVHIQGVEYILVDNLQSEGNYDKGLNLTNPNATYNAGSGIAFVRNCVFKDNAGASGVASYIGVQSAGLTESILKNNLLIDDYIYIEGTATAGTYEARVQDNTMLDLSAVLDFGLIITATIDDTYVWHNDRQGCAISNSASGTKTTTPPA